ncbi:hypothetical protein RHSIM_Rhsim03G0116600 [Rhododendron simsii]|uniref:Uncharacterized protein n=1 Tax=Rhododendron simsii TaxID=118357 RepID=A0A834H5Y3_RHOSS|nr:hypothetical protein RHSIM_Rhsim03G0116600 [Rhododendron simsii]
METVGVRPVALHTPGDVIIKDSHAPPPRTKQGNILKGSGLAKVCKKLKGCKEKLKVWHKQNFGDFRLQIATLKDRLAHLQEQQVSFSNSDCMVEEKIIKSKLEDLWQKDAMYWHQRSRIKWLQMGDKNSRFFHLSTIHRRQRNQVVKLKDEAGIWKMEETDISDGCDFGSHDLRFVVACGLIREGLFVILSAIYNPCVYGTLYYSWFDSHLLPVRDPIKLVDCTNLT